MSTTSSSSYFLTSASSISTLHANVQSALFSPIVSNLETLHHLYATQWCEMHLRITELVKQAIGQQPVNPDSLAKRQVVLASSQQLLTIAWVAMSILGCPAWNPELYPMRADAILHHRAPGSALLFPSNTSTPWSFCLHVKTAPQEIRRYQAAIGGDGFIYVGENRYHSLVALARDLGAYRWISPPPTQLSLGELFWLTTDKLPEDLLQTAEAGVACVTPGPGGTHGLHVKRANGAIQYYSIASKQSTALHIRENDTQSTRTVSTLASVLADPKHPLQISRIVTGYPSLVIEELFHGDLLPKLLASQEAVCRVSRREFASLFPTSYYAIRSRDITDNTLGVGLYYQRHKKGLILTDGTGVDGTDPWLIDSGGRSDVYELPPYAYTGTPFVRRVVKEEGVSLWPMERTQHLQEAYRPIREILFGQHLSYTSSSTGKVRKVWLMRRMEFDLSNLISSKVVLSASDKKSIMAQITRGLRALHRNGGVHADLKLENILLRRAPWAGWVACVCDPDGVTYPMADTKTKHLTRQYAAPEARTKEVTGLAAAQQLDLFALGLIFYYLWVPQATLFYTAEEQTLVTDEELVSRIFHGVQPSTAPDSMERIIYELLHPTPNRPSAETVLTRIEHLTQNDA